MRILFIEDQRRLGVFLAKSQLESGYIAAWVQTFGGARAGFCASGCDVVVLEYKLP